MPTIRVIRPFTFSYPLGTSEKVARERHFPIGEHEIEESVADHPFIAKHFADGCIETPEQARKRAEEAATVAKKAQDDADYWKAHAEAAFKRAEALSIVQTNGDPKALERELNTPVNQLGAQQGAGIQSSAPAVPEGESQPAGASGDSVDSGASTAETGKKSKNK